MEKPVLQFVAEEGYWIWDGRELYPRHSGQEMVLFRHLLAHKGHWLHWERLGAVLWPAEFPANARCSLSKVAGFLASTLVGTSACLDRRPGYGYRLSGEIEVV